MPRTSNTVPSYCRQKVKGGNDRAYVKLGDRRVWLGTWGTAESKQRYGQVIAEWRADGMAPAPAKGITVVELAVRFIKYSDTYYLDPAGEPTGEADNFRLALRPMTGLYAGTAAAEFGPKRLKAVRQRMIEDGWCRTSINRQVSRIRQVFRWAVEQELIPAATHLALAAVKALARGRTDAVESAPVRPAAQEHVEAVLPHLSPTLRAMVEVQALTGARAAEVCMMRTCDIVRAGTVWLYTPPRHKTEHHDKVRTIYIGPKAQAVLAPLLKPDLQAPIFDPRESAAWHREHRHKRRRTPPTQGNTIGSNVVSRPKRRPGHRYDVAAYRRAITRACDKADSRAKAGRVIGDDERLVPRFTPHQLRHALASKLRADHGIDSAQQVLGHALGSKITEVYAEQSQQRAMQIMAVVG
jgi:integrase